MAIARWDPFREMMSMRQMMDRLFEEGFTRQGREMMAGWGSFPVDVADRDNHFEVRAELPGVKPEDVQLTLEGNTLTIRGEMKAEEEQKREDWLVRERQMGSFARTITFPHQIDPNQTEARCENGIIIITLPKAEGARPKQIKIGGQPQLGRQGDGQSREASGSRR